MISRLSTGALALILACAALPAHAQGLRVTPQVTLRAPDIGPRPADFIVAVVNSEPITNNEVRMRLLRYEQQLQQQGQPLPPRSELAVQVLERLVNEKAQLQLARENGLKVDEAQVDQAEQNFARNNGLTVAELRERMRAEGADPSRFREDLRSQMLLQRVRDRELESRVRVTELDIDQYLRDARSGNDLTGLELGLAHILIAVPETASDAQVAQLQAKAQRALARVRAGEDFGKVAAEMSDAAGAATNGGQIGLRSADRLPPLFVEAVKDLPSGGVSNIIRSAAGFHIVKVLEKHQAGLPGAAVTQSHVRHILLRPGPQLTEAQALERLAEFKRRVQAGNADFAQLARDFSQDASARNGGDLGWVNPGVFVPEFEETLDHLKPGEISEPVITRFGVHLVQLLERREVTLSEREQRELVRNLVRERKLDEAYVSWAQEVRGRAFVEYREPPQI
ncbi:MAG TPA: peptidylprolyl isomerase [Ramlibacter sp.]|uniref:peptidylprolyl isomerase n=1 Tax=Ramlibacter sp. TaxID=1917967 RepID=UPI002CDA6C28|nr:peptidylprolyl isomerase [Ramlibacter sp.]HVZ46961.1 peptidylprolyl isomerase [Ramlibacter sp.]